MAVTVSASVRGATHVRDNKPCQDAVSIKEGTFQGKPYLICSVADGHGSAAFTHSDAGSLMAALAAEKTAIQFLLTRDTRFENRGERFVGHVRQYLKDEWEENIRQSWQAFHIGRSVIRKHGTTLLSVLVYDGYVYMTQLGDGDICYLDQTGQPVFLVKPETGPTNSVTSSLCSQDANECWNVACLPVEDIRFLMMSSDGLMNSLANNDEYVKLASSLQNYCGKFRPSEICSVLPQWLTDYSETGCGDDISLVAIHFETNKTEPGEEHDKDTEHSRTEHREKTGGRWPGRSVHRKQKWTAACFKALQQLKRHPGAEKYYLLSCTRRRSRCRLRK